jgi:hypothetical protein
MVWLFAIVVAVLLVFSAGFRKLALWLTALAAVGIAIVQFNYKQESAAALTRIPVSQLALEGVTLDTGGNYGYSLSGRIRNNSPTFTLTLVRLLLTFQDCPANSSSSTCLTIGEEAVSAYVDIPPGQARDFKESVVFHGPNPTPKGRMVWSYSVQQTTAK